MLQAGLKVAIKRGRLVMHESGTYVRFHAAWRGAIRLIAEGSSRKFEDPIDLPGGRKPVTLRDAGNYIIKLSKAEHTAPEWQAAMQALMIVARGGPTMLASMWILRAPI